MKIYIAGPMTGLPEENFPAFYSAESLLKSLGHTTSNPASHGHSTPGKTRPWFMRRDIPMLMECDAIALLPGWINSIGARCELTIALTLEMPVLNALTGAGYNFTKDVGSLLFLATAKGEK